MPLDPLDMGGEPDPNASKPMPERLAEAILRMDVSLQDMNENIANLVDVILAADNVLRREEFAPESGAKQLRFTTQRFLDLYNEEREAQEEEDNEDTDLSGPAPN